MWSETESDFIYTPLMANTSAAGRLRMLYHRFPLRVILLLMAVGFGIAVLLAGSGNQNEINPIVNTVVAEELRPVSTAPSLELLQTEASNLLKATPKPILLESQIKPNYTAFIVPIPNPYASSRRKGSGNTNSDPSSIQDPTVSPVYTNKPSFWNGSFRFEGNPTSKILSPGFGKLVGNKSDVLKLELTNVTIDAGRLIADLTGCTRLRTISLINVYVVGGDIGRIYLPSLESFILHQLGDSGDEAKLATYQDPVKLKSSLFFDKSANTSWDLVKDVANLGVHIEFQLNGVTVIKISEETEEIVFNIPYCDEVLQSISWSLSTLSLLYCNITVSSIPVNLLYFNVYKVWVKGDGNFTQIISSFTRLTDFTAQIPGEILNLSDFPATLTTLTVIDTDLDYRNDYRSSILNFVTGYHLGPKVLECIDKIMPTVQRVAFFGIPDEIEANILLQKILLNTTAQWIAVEDFKRNPNSNFPIQQWVEQYLTTLGIPQTSTNFLIKLNRTSFNGFSPKGSRNGREMTSQEIDYFHYVLLGWYKAATFEAFVRIQTAKLANLG